MEPFPTVEQAYAYVHREVLQQAVMASKDSDEPPGAILASKGLRLGSTARVNSLKGGPNRSGSKKSKGVDEEMKCSYCGNSKHTREYCFKLNGYPNWWHELHEKKEQKWGRY